MNEILSNLVQGIEIRSQLIALRQQIKETQQKESFQEFFLEHADLLHGFLHHEDPKVRKNAALLIGDLRLKEFQEQLFACYEAEETLFIRKDYLKALDQMDLAEYLEPLQERFDRLSALEIPAEEEKHYREELALLSKILLRSKKRKQHVFTGWDRPLTLLLTTNPNHREVTARQVKAKQILLTPLGVKAVGAKVSEVLSIPTYREMLFLTTAQVVPEDPAQAAHALAESKILAFLKETHQEGEGFYFRISIAGKMPLDKRSQFIKKCSFALEQLTNRQLINTPSDYEVEIRLMERKDGTFLPLLKLYTIKDSRFAYRKESIAASIHPSDAALLAALAKPYLKENAQVLDPFCGVGTMLIERNRLVTAGPMYGIDIFGEAIKKARENATGISKEIYYINRDFFDFTHGYLFDEIFTNMPVRGKKTREEQETLYQNFFQKVTEVMKPEGILVLYSNEKGHIKKQLRLHEKWKLLQEFVINEKEEFSLFVIKV